jgi:enamine deaminase RidA (YjgF/YER057c/UK114 family)
VTVRIRPLTGDGSPPVEGSYPQAVEVTDPARWLHLSGQIPVAPDGALAPDFIGQCERSGTISRPSWPSPA